MSRIQTTVSIAAAVYCLGGNAHALSTDAIFADSFEQSEATTLVSGGGTVAIPGVISVDFPTPSFSQPTTVSVKKTRSEQIAERMQEFTQLFAPSHRLSYEVIVDIDGLPPETPIVNATIPLPGAFAAQIPVDYEPEVVVEVVSGSAEEAHQIFIMVPSTHMPSNGVVIAEIPSSAFYEVGQGSYRTVVSVIATPGTNQGVSKTMGPYPFPVVKGVSECLASAIVCPVSIGCDVTSPFADERDHPVHTGTTRPHYGVDYRAPTGTEIVAADDATVERSYSSDTFGNTVILRHLNGSATLYAHLNARTVSAGQSVTRGTPIGLAGATGTATGPHLHFEYVPNGRIIMSKNRIDPNACVGTVTTGSITVRDDGSLADDAFSVYFNGVFIGSTTIGQANTLSVSNLLPGTYDLRIEAITAPDNIGTYEVTLADGLLFADGTSIKSGVLAQGESVTFSVDVPEPL